MNFLDCHLRFNSQLIDEYDFYRLCSSESLQDKKERVHSEDYLCIDVARL